MPTGKAHWEVLLRARAIENQCYVIASAQVGKHNEKRASYGHSMVVDPWGKILLDLNEESPVFRVVDIDLDYLDEVRHSMPISKSFRNDLYIQLPLTKSIQNINFYLMYFMLCFYSLKEKIDSEFYMFGESIKLSNKVVISFTIVVVVDLIYRL